MPLGACLSTYQPPRLPVPPLEPRLKTSPLKAPGHLCALQDSSEVLVTGYLFGLSKAWELACPFLLILCTSDLHKAAAAQASKADLCARKVPLKSHTSSLDRLSSALQHRQYQHNSSASTAVEAVVQLHCDSGFTCQQLRSDIWSRSSS
jgi:hypothetical protein